MQRLKSLGSPQFLQDGQENIIPKEFCNAENLKSHDHGERIFQRIIRIISNEFFNNQRKRNNELVVKDRVSKI